MRASPAGFHGSYKVDGMLMVRSGTQDGVDGFVIQQPAVILVSCRIWHEMLGRIQAARIEVGYGDRLCIWARQRGCRISVPRPPAPISPKRTQSLARAALEATLAMPAH